jgi:hypothetical protein
MTEPGSAQIEHIGEGRQPDENTDAPGVAVDERERAADLDATGWPEPNFQPPGSGPQLDEGTT